MKCPNCSDEISHFEHIGEMENRVCPLCHDSISDEQVADYEATKASEETQSEPENV